jgi:hypothetical protein
MVTAGAILVSPVTVDNLWRPPSYPARATRGQDSLFTIANPPHAATHGATEKQQDEKQSGLNGGRVSPPGPSKYLVVPEFGLTTPFENKTGLADRETETLRSPEAAFSTLSRPQMQPSHPSVGRLESPPCTPRARPAAELSPRSRYPPQKSPRSPRSPRRRGSQEVIISNSQVAPFSRPTHKDCCLSSW